MRENVNGIRLGIRGGREMNEALYWIVGWAAVAMTSSVVAWILAAIKNRDISYWVAWTFLVPPLVIVLALMPRSQGTRPRRPTLDEQERNNW
jgi:hypothetical protein